MSCLCRWSWCHGVKRWHFQLSHNGCAGPPVVSVTWCRDKKGLGALREVVPETHPPGTERQNPKARVPRVPRVPQVPRKEGWQASSRPGQLCDGRRLSHSPFSKWPYQCQVLGMSQLRERPPGSSRSWCPVVGRHSRTCSHCAAWPWPCVPPRGPEPASSPSSERLYII